MLEVRLLGQFDIRRDDQVIHLPLRPAQSLFAYLLLHPGTPHRREKLAGLIWPDLPESSARGNLRHTLWRLRKALGLSPHTGRDYVLADESVLALDPQADLWVDTRVLEQRPSGPPSLAALLRSVEVYRGELLPGHEDDWVTYERERLQAAFETSMAHLLDALVQAQQWDDVLAWGERWIALGRIPEAAYRALILAHAARGDIAAVAAAYQRCLKALREHLGVDPSPATRAAYDRALQTSGSPPLITRPNPPLPRHNLPAPLTLFVGRERELDELHRLLAEPGCRLVTLVGPAGAGKTRLALELARRLLPDYADGAWVADLAPHDRAEAVPAAVSAALGLQPAPDLPLAETLAAVLKDRRLILVLDNCEHVLDGVAPLATHLLEQCASLRVLATSREMLHVAGEYLYLLSGLSLPVADGSVEALLESGSGRLLADRANAAYPGFAVNAHNAGDLARLCRALDGLPLALELAAAHLSNLSPGELAARLDERFWLLDGGRATLVRHRSLQAAIDWSYQRLSDAERQLFRRLSVFRGGWTLEAAEQVCAGEEVAAAAVVALLGGLVDKSLVAAETTGGGTRYRLLETLQEYGRMQLDASGQARRVSQMHNEYFVRLAEEAQTGIDTPDEPAWLLRLSPDEDNLFVAIERSLDDDGGAAALRIGSALNKYLSDTARRRSEYVDLMTRALDQRPEVGPLKRSRVLKRIAETHRLGGRIELAQAAVEEALQLAQASGDRAQVACALTAKGFCQAINADPACYAAAVELARQTGDIEAAFAMRRLALFEPPEAARALLVEYHALALRRGSLSALARAAGGFGDLAYTLGDLGEAERQWLAGLHLNDLLSKRWNRADILARLASACWSTGDYARAASFLDDDFDVLRGSGWLPGLAGAFFSRGTLAWWQGDFAAAEAYFRESDASDSRWNRQFFSGEISLRWARLARDAGDLAKAEALGQAARQILLNGALPGRLPLCEAALASIAHHQGDPARAVGLYREALRSMPTDRNLLDLRDVLEGHALALAASAELPLAARLLGFAAARLAAFGAVRPVPEQRFYDQELARLKASLPANLLVPAWASGQPLTFEQAVAEALGES